VDRRTAECRSINDRLQALETAAAQLAGDIAAKRGEIEASKIKARCETEAAAINAKADALAATIETLRKDGTALLAALDQVAAAVPGLPMNLDTVRDAMTNLPAPTTWSLQPRSMRVKPSL
jgi:chromosome segregation ATPase